MKNQITTNRAYLFDKKFALLYEYHSQNINLLIGLLLIEIK